MQPNNQFVSFMNKDKIINKEKTKLLIWFSNEQGLLSS